MSKKAFVKLSIEDICKYPVWEFCGNGRSVVPIQDLPVTTLVGRVVGLQVQLANGNPLWGILTNLTLEEPKYNPHLVSARLDVSGKWFDLGRYFDADYEDRTPELFSKAIGLSIDAIFPIAYDLSAMATGAQNSIRGQIPAVVEPRLPLCELMKFIVKKHAP